MSPLVAPNRLWVVRPVRSGGFAVGRQDWTSPQFVATRAEADAIAAERNAQEAV